ncbi:hypothetical protein KY321_05485 [Candidatus Woesearchaeota archaeon]|nr:hypothetical protein [Candidatus Woesearchaeota archaeon]
MTVNAPVLTIVSLEPGSITVNNSDTFQVTVEVECVGFCGNVNISLDPYIQEKPSIWKKILNFFRSITGMASGNLVSQVNGTIPFYTNNTNPYQETAFNNKKQNFTWTVTANGPAQTYTFFEFVNSSVGNPRTSDYFITIPDNPPVILTQTPANGTGPTEGSITFSYTASDDHQLDNCSLIGDFTGTMELYQTKVTESGSFSISLDKGIYNWTIECFDNNSQSNDLVYHALNVYEVVIINTGGGGGGSNNECTGSECDDDEEEEEETCSVSWICDSWSSCEDGEESRFCFDANNCGTRRSDTETRSCDCDEDWSCSDWGECSNGRQIRSCSDDNDCGTSEDKPDEYKSCTEEIDEEEQDEEEKEKNKNKDIVDEIVDFECDDETCNEIVDSMLRDMSDTFEKVNLTKELVYNNDTNETTVKVNLVAEEDLENFKYYQNIPKCMAYYVHMIKFKNTDFEIIKEDPLIVWNYDKVQAGQTLDFSFDIEGKVPPECFKLLSELLSEDVERHSPIDNTWLGALVLIATVSGILVSTMKMAPSKFKRKHLEKINKIDKEVNKIFKKI